MPALTILCAVFVDIIVVTMTHGSSMQLEVVPIESSPVGLAADKKAGQSAGQSADQGVDQIRVMTINMAHGRADGRNQMLQSTAIIQENVDNIGQLIARENAQVVALQEADAPSWWSGKFSHVERVATVGGMASAVQGRNVDGLGLHYGAAVVTELKVSGARQVTFEKNAPTFSKGFVVVTCSWPGYAGFEFDVVSLHLDFASATVRSRQLAILGKLVKQSARPIILMGDFNTDMSKDLLPKFLQETGLQTWRVNDSSIVTFPVLGSRIDWIFTSPEFRIVEQRVLDDVLSDHSIVVATLERGA